MNINLKEILFNEMDKLRTDIPNIDLFSNEEMEKSPEFSYFINAMKEACRQTTVTTNMKDNEAFVICIQTDLGECYLGQRDGVMSKIRGAVFYHDDLYAKSELDRIIKQYKNNPFFNDPTKLSVKPVEFIIKNISTENLK